MITNARKKMLYGELQEAVNKTLGLFGENCQ